MSKKLYRSSTNKMMAGICGGLGDYFDVDPTVVRIIAVIFLFASGGAAVLAYIVGWFIIPEVDEQTASENIQRSAGNEVSHRNSRTWTRYLPGLILIFFGSMLLIREHWFWFSWDEFWPVLLIGLGLIVIFAYRKSPNSSSVHAANNHQNAHNEGAAL